MVGRIPITVACGLVVVGCVASNATPCGDLTCPVGRICVLGDRCVDDSVVTSCASQAEGASCEVPDVGAGTCQGGFCLVGRCGDGEINAIDECDGDNLGTHTCLDLGSTEPAGLKCTADCALDYSACTAVCGDGVKNSLEECDGTDFGDRSCLTEGAYEGDLVCTTTCTINSAQCTGTCGDGIVNGLEDCDGMNLGGTTCESRGYLGVTLPISCTLGCGFAASSCTCGGVLCQPTTEQCVQEGGLSICRGV